MGTAMRKLISSFANETKPRTGKLACCARAAIARLANEDIRPRREAGHVTNRSPKKMVKPYVAAAPTKADAA